MSGLSDIQSKTKEPTVQKIAWVIGYLVVNLLDCPRTASNAVFIYK